MNRAYCKAIADLKIGEVYTAMKCMLRACKERECTLCCARKIADDLHAFLLDACRQGMLFRDKAFFTPLQDALAQLTTALCVKEAEVDSMAKAFEAIQAGNQRIFSN